jgi:uncharacterized membrane protein YeaQ/YmgE (transglycosylase-associated protein family)
MGIMAWIIQGLAAGLPARMLTRGRAPGIVMTCLPGIHGAPLGGWLASGRSGYRTVPR